MNSDHQNFAVLRRLLKLKRHEQPPPRFFNDFSTQVINRLKNPSASDQIGSLESLAWEAPWLQRLIGAFQSKPMLAGSFGAAVCGILLLGMAYAERIRVPAPGSELSASIQSPIPSMPTAFANSAATLVAGGGSNLFDSIGTPSFQPVRYQTLGQ